MSPKNDNAPSKITQADLVFTGLILAFIAGMALYSGIVVVHMIF